jgi:hypothetical protein
MKPALSGLCCFRRVRHLLDVCEASAGTEHLALNQPSPREIADIFSTDL